MHLHNMQSIVHTSSLYFCTSGFITTIITVFKRKVFEKSSDIKVYSTEYLITVSLHSSLTYLKMGDSYKNVYRLNRMYMCWMYSIKIGRKCIYDN